MKRIADDTDAEPGEVAVKTAAALYAVCELLGAARRAGNIGAIEAAEFSIEALASVVPDAVADRREFGGNVVPFPGRG